MSSLLLMMLLLPMAIVVTSCSTTRSLSCTNLCVNTSATQKPPLSSDPCDLCELQNFNTDALVETGNSSISHYLSYDQPGSTASLFTCSTSHTWDRSPHLDETLHLCRISSPKRRSARRRLRSRCRRLRALSRPPTSSGSKDSALPITRR